MKLFGRKSGRDEARPVLGRGRSWFGIAPGGNAGVGGWPSAYEMQARDAYLTNPVAQRAVRLVAQGLGEAPIETSEPAVAALIDAPSAGQPLLETLAAQLLLHGNAYVRLLGDGAGGVRELIALRPERMAVDYGADGWATAYRYTITGAPTRMIADGPRPEVVHIRGFHPLDDHYGAGALGTAAGAVAIHNAATRWNKALLDNAARPSGALVYDPGDGAVMSAEQFARVRTEMEEGFAGAANAGRPMLLEGGLKWQAMSLTPADMDFIALKAAAARDIALAFGVPPMLIGLPGDATYANYREASRALWRLTILPLAGSILNALTHGLRGWWPDLMMRVNIDRVTALAEDRALLWRSVSGADFLTAEEKRAMLGITA